MITDDDLNEMEIFAKKEYKRGDPRSHMACENRGREIFLLISELRELRKKPITRKITEDRLDEAIHMARLHQRMACADVDENALSTIRVVLRRLLVHGENDFGISLPDIETKLVEIKCSWCNVNGVLKTLYVNNVSYKTGCKSCIQEHFLEKGDWSSVTGKSV